MVCQEEDRKGTKYRVMCKIGERDVTVRCVKGHCTSCGRGGRGMSGRRWAGLWWHVKYRRRRTEGGRK